MMVGNACKILQLKSKFLRHTSPILHRKCFDTLMEKQDCIQLHKDCVSLGNKRKTLYISAMYEKHCFFVERPDFKLSE